jgi:hypothetical protein
MLRVLGASVYLSSLVSSYDCEFRESYPRQYVAHKVGPSDLVIDGRLNEDAWQFSNYTTNFVDISTSTTPMFLTQAKILWDDNFLYIGASLQESDIWANITETCHCNTDSADQVIYHDNDFEVFIDVDGDTHYYKEFEMNSLNATWDLVLNKPYADGGYENSSRVFGDGGYDMQPPLTCAVHVDGTVNDPSSEDKSWTLEIAFPIVQLTVNETATVPPTNGTFWRINFSRVEWSVDIINGKVYWKSPSCQSCTVPGTMAEDNWVWSPQGEVNMHLPEKWGMLQFTTAPPGEYEPEIVNDEWPVRSVAMVLYYAEHAYRSSSGNGTFTSDLETLNAYADPPILAAELCSQLPRIKLTSDEKGFEAHVSDREGVYMAVIRDDRLLRVSKKQ